MAQFINPFTDIGFKRIFGQEISKPLLLDFLNNLLAGEEHIVNLSFLDKEQPALYEDDRSLIYDIYCETDEGKKIIVEMQNKSQPYFKNRSIYYVSEAIARQGERGSGWNYGIDAVYLVAFLNFCPMDFKQKFRTDVVLKDKETNDDFSDKIRSIYAIVPSRPSFALPSYSFRNIVDTAVLEIRLRFILHFHNNLLALIGLAIDIID